ncbi:TPA: HD domain-containing protein [Candidatus Bathyarchaeota archaeon]|nr:HD domain-containing protein [Candidatus Bathyarchaeota archaeon]HIJ09091.1 HD domain-containing protein [Candidatus Bathyarchaeota archaeon]
MSYVFNIPVNNNIKLERLMKEVKTDTKLRTFWKCANVMAIDRMGYTDHGPTHVKIVANLALRLLRILVERKVKPNVVKDYGMKNDDAEVVVVMGSILHDLGMIVTRHDHEKYGVLLSKEFIERCLSPVYTAEEIAIMTSEILHAVVCHERPNNPLTLEAGIVGIADALDMEAGRARIPFESGKIDIHAVSALSIEKVEIREDGKKPITIRIRMSNSAGVFQIDELLKPRIENSGLQKYFHVVAEITGERETRIIDKFEI